jgi:hypothetical protein
MIRTIVQRRAGNHERPASTNVVQRLDTELAQDFLNKYI